MCDELRLTTKDQVKKWQKFFRETENMLKKLEIWRLNLHHLFKKVSKERMLSEKIGFGIVDFAVNSLKLKLNGISRNRTRIVGFNHLLSATNIIICFLLTA